MLPARTAFAFDTIESAVTAMARGEFVVVMDDEGRENEGDLIIPAVGCSTEQMAWMIKHTRCGPAPLPAADSALTGLYPFTITQRIHLYLTSR
jgi:3,4-dihydroxy-2-butanone 4-phosphate synthase